ncbi:hypothetical protein NPIL_413711, partial [Nephila pilipes]
QDTRLKAPAEIHSVAIVSGISSHPRDVVSERPRTLVMANQPARVKFSRNALKNLCVQHSLSKL